MISLIHLINNDIIDRVPISEDRINRIIFKYKTEYSKNSIMKFIKKYIGCKSLKIIYFQIDFKKLCSIKEFFEKNAHEYYELYSNSFLLIKLGGLIEILKNKKNEYLTDHYVLTKLSYVVNLIMIYDYIKKLFNREERIKAEKNGIQKLLLKNILMPIIL